MIIAAIRLSAMLMTRSLSIDVGGGRLSSMSAWVNSIVSTVTKSCQSIVAKTLASSSRSFAFWSSRFRFEASHSARLRASSSVFHLICGSASALTSSSTMPAGGCMIFWYDSTIRL